MSIMEKFSDPQMIDSLSTGETLLAALYMTGLGMLIIFSVLLILWFLTSVLSRTFRDRRPPTAGAREKIPMPKPIQAIGVDDQLIAVISAALARERKNGRPPFQVKKITPARDELSPWSRAGIMERLNNRIQPDLSTE